MLRLENITKDFYVDKEQVTHVLKGITIQFRSCEFVSILGHSGCGKTTLLNIIGGLDKYTSGAVYLDGASTKTFSDSDWNDFRNRQIGFVFQSYNLIPHQTVLRNVEMPLILAEVPEEERKRRALEALEKVGLRDQAKKRPTQMSGGQMQRVAIARAIVNNPSIILADEPTGALDSESGRQVMDILKDIAKEKLVIMVTHNDMLADEYSTRIIRMNDGVIIDDTDNYSLEECLAAEETDRARWEEEEILKAEEKEAKKKQKTRKKTENKPAPAVDDGILADETENNGENTEKKTNAVKKIVKGTKNGIKKLTSSFRHKGNTHMSFGTAVRLSASNLNSKKGRSLLTSLAGSIGIIGIMLVLCLSNGATAYINSIEENALSVYPMTVTQNNAVDFTSMVGTLMSKDESKEAYPTDGIVTPKKVLGNILESVLNSFLSKPNDLKQFKEYIAENFDDSDGYVKYDYGVDFSVFCNYTKDPDAYMQVDPFLEGMNALFDKMPDGVLNALKGSGVLDMLQDESTGVAAMMSVWEQLPSNDKLLTSQYELVGKQSRWPSAWNEVVMVVDDRNQVYDFSLFALGLAGTDEVLSAISGNKDFLDKQYTIDDLLSLEYRIMTNSDYYDKIYDEDGNWTGEWDTTAASSSGYEYRRKVDFVESHSEKVKVVGVIRPKPGVTITCMNGLIGYTEALQEHLSDRVMQSEIYVEQMKEENRGGALIDYNDKNLKHPGSEKFTESDLNDIAKYLGAADFDTPTRVYMYANSFEGKENIDKFIARYNEENDANIEYTDMLGMITGYVDALTETITYILMGFAGISLIVSSIMIAIIIYTSVLERRKEIGVLRSIGARKKDISTVFIAESGILGVISGAIGILIAYILSLIANAILYAILAVPGLATLAWWHPVMMMLISVLLSILAGFVPARIASNKHPVECLRTE